jgi:pimeloyl-ACP methyl ester carboxylesterase
MAAQQAQEKVRSADGTPIAYWRSGSGPPLVLVHGTTADHSRWRPVLDRFEQHATVCAMDRRGRGASGDTDPYDLQREFEDVAAVVDHVADRHDGPVDLFGHSHGALCALEAALLTDRLAGLVLYEPPLVNYSIDAAVVGRLEQLLDEGRPGEVIATFFTEVVGMPADELDHLRGLPAWSARVAAAHTLPREERAAVDYRFDPGRFAGVTVPVLLLLGGDSPQLFSESTRAIAPVLPDARVCLLEGQQHVAIDTAPDLLTSEILAFLGRL